MNVQTLVDKDNKSRYANVDRRKTIGLSLHKEIKAAKDLILRMGEVVFIKGMHTNWLFNNK